MPLGNFRSAMLERKDLCEVMCMGYGKFLVYQIRAVKESKVVILVSPLTSSEIGK